MKLFFLFLMWSIALLAQTTTARITGIVTDSSGAVIANAPVTVSSLSTGIARPVSTGSDGAYLVTNLVVGNYAVVVAATGFKRFEQRPVRLEVDQTVRVDVTLQTGDTKESITVEGGQTLVNTETSALGQIVDNKTIIQMPISGRNFLALATLVPGATAGAPGNDVVRSRQEGVTLSVNGQRVEHNNYMLDGVDNNATLFGNAVIVPSLDAVQEFKVQTSSYSAEYGRAAGAVVNVALKNGSNQLHGTLFEFLRNDKLDANGFFANYFRNLRQPLRQNAFGASVGGPAIRNKLFWFGNYEGFQGRYINVGPALLPTSAQRAGDFSGLPAVYDPLQLTPEGARVPFANNQIPAARIAAPAARLVALYPQPNVTGDPTRNFQTSFSNPSTRHQAHGRGDWQISPHDALMGRYSWTDREDVASNINYNGQTTGNKHKGGVVAYTKTLTPMALNEIRYGLTLYRFSLIPDGIGRDFTTELGLPSFATSADLKRFPTVNVTNFAGFGGNDAIPLFRDENVNQLIDQFTWIRGRHALKAGGDWRKYGNRNFQPQTSAGFYVFNGSFTGERGRTYANGLADLLLGLPQQQRILNPAGFDAGRLRNQKLSLYLQDDWSVHPRLTLNLGVRWERDGAWTEVNNRWSIFDYSAGTVAYAKDAKLDVDLRYPISRWRNNELRRAINNVAPRLGLAWRPFGGNRTVLRAAYGVFWAQPIANVQLQQTLNPPFLLRTDVTSGTTTPELRFGVFPSVNPSSLVPAIPPIATMSPDSYLNGYTQQWNFGVERAIGSAMVARGSYVGSKGTHLERRQEGNPALPPGPGAIQTRRRFPLIAGIVDQTSNSNSTYHALQLSFERRLQRGLQLTTNYTWSKSLDDTSAWTGLTGQESAFGQDPSRLFLDKGLSGFNVAHRFTSTVLYELPWRFGNKWAQGVLGGWQTSAITVVQSGFPLSITTQGDLANAGTRLVRANVNGPWELSGGVRNIDQWFSRGAFSAPPSFTFGTAARNLVTAPGLVNIDLTAMKTLRIIEGHTLQIRGEFYNAPNHFNPGAPGSLFASPAFGIIRGAAQARNVQIALKYIF
ncbi:MAG: TonB-dependent receptor [Bryobacteraceae bacterium]|nr:TonB-dependent receptor [Bryobacteraceae bacterium]